MAQVELWAKSLERGPGPSGGPRSGSRRKDGAVSRLSDLGRRRSTLQAPKLDLGGLDDLALVGVALVVDAPGGPVTVPGLKLHFGRAGLGISRHDGTEVATIGWGLLRHAATSARPTGTSGATVPVVLDISSDRRNHRFVVPNAEPVALGAMVNSLSTRYGGHELVPAASPGRSGRRSRRPGDS